MGRIITVYTQRKWFYGTHAVPQLVKASIKSKTVTNKKQAQNTWY